jgi:hypothetical protein
MASSKGIRSGYNLRITGCGLRPRAKLISELKYLPEEASSECITCCHATVGALQKLSTALEHLE